MTWVITSLCQDCVDMSCVDVCPVDCIVQLQPENSPTAADWIKNQLYIDPDECIDCGVCEPECPTDAIFADTDKKSKAWNEINKELSLKWPNISKKKQCFSKEEQDKWAKVKNKAQYLSKKPAPPEVIKE